MNTDILAAEEKQRLTSLLISCLDSQTMKMLEPVIDNVAWMHGKLIDAREQIKGSSVCIPYDNGGGQKGIRENPLFKGYESLFKSYMTGLKAIMDYLPKDVKIEPVESPKTVLQLVRSKHGKEA